MEMSNPYINPPFTLTFKISSIGFISGALKKPFKCVRDSKIEHPFIFLSVLAALGTFCYPIVLTAWMFVDTCHVYIEMVTV